MALPQPVDKETLRRTWYEQLGSLFSDLEGLHEDHLDESHMSQLRIRTSSFNIELDDVTDSTGARFFTPFHRHRLKVSSCSIDPPTHRTLGSRFGLDNVDFGAYCWGRGLSSVIGKHMQDIRRVYPSKWKIVR